MSDNIEIFKIDGHHFIIRKPSEKPDQYKYYAGQNFYYDLAKVKLYHSKEAAELSIEYIKQWGAEEEMIDVFPAYNPPRFINKPTTLE